MTLSSENTSSSKSILPWCSREAQETAVMDLQAELGCCGTASAAEQSPSTLPSCAGAPIVLCGDVMPLPGGRNPGSIPHASPCQCRHVCQQQSWVVGLQLPNTPFQCLDYTGRMTRIPLCKGQSSFLKNVLMMPTEKADAVPRLPEHRLPTRPVMNSGPPCFGSHRDWKII